MCQTTGDIQSSTMNIGYEDENVQASSSVEMLCESTADHNYDDDNNNDNDESEGAYAFSQLKLQSERQRTTLTELETKKRKDWPSSGTRKNWLSVLEDCFSLSSLEVDMGSEYDDHDIVSSVEDRFSSSSRHGSMDFIPPQPLSSERDVRHQTSEMRGAWHHSEQSLEHEEKQRKWKVDTPAQDLHSALRESRWSSSSDTTMRQDALNVLLDRVSYSHHHDSFLNSGADTPFLTRRLSMADCEDRLVAPQTRKSHFPVLTRRISSPHDQRWQGTLGVSTQDFAIPSPSIYCRGRDH